MGNGTFASYFLKQIAADLEAKTVSSGLSQSILHHASLKNVQSRLIMVGAALAMMVAYFVLAILALLSVAYVHETPGFMRYVTQNHYLIEFSLLVTNNYYYVLGYCGYTALTYLWFSSLQQSSITGVSSVMLLLLEFVRAVVFILIFTFLVLRCMPSLHVDDIQYSAPTETRKRLRVLAFKTCVVISVCAVADFPTYFTTIFLADVANVGSVNQILLLYLWALLGLVPLTWADMSINKKDPTVRNKYILECSRWLVSFLTWTPWLKTVTGIVDLSIDGVGSGWTIFFQFVCAVLATCAIAFVSNFIHICGDGTVTQRARALSLRIRRSFSRDNQTNDYGPIRLAGGFSDTETSINGQE